MSTVISVENVSKYYRLGLIGGGTLSADLERWWARVRGRPDPLLKACPEHKRRIGQEDYANRQGEYIWALRDVSFEACPAHHPPLSPRKQGEDRAGEHLPERRHPFDDAQGRPGDEKGGDRPQV